jgi:hypothetical protein
MVDAEPANVTPICPLNDAGALAWLRAQPGRCVPLSWQADLVDHGNAHPSDLRLGIKRAAKLIDAVDLNAMARKIDERPISLVGLIAERP